MQQNQPGVVKDNPLTRAMDYARSLNVERGSPIARQSGETPMVTAQVIPASMATPLSMEEVELRDRAARAAGIMPEEEQDTPSDAEAEYKFLRRAALMPEEDPILGSPYRDEPLRKPSQSRSKLIDFKKIQGIDLIRGIVWVDSFEIKIPQNDIVKFKQYALDLAVNFVTEQLAAAMAELTPLQEEVNDSGQPAETLPEVQGD